MTGRSRSRSGTTAPRTRSSTALTLNWPSATNGNLKKVKLDGDMIYDKPDIAGGTANLTAAQLRRSEQAQDQEGPVGRA